MTSLLRTDAPRLENDSDIPKFTVANYLMDHLSILLIAIFCIAGILCMLPILGVSIYGVIFVAAFVGACFIVALFIDYRRKLTYYHELSQLLNQLEQSIGFESLFSEPSFLEGRINYETTSILSALNTKNIADMKTSSDEYRRYIELWIHEIKTPIAAIKLMLSDRTDAQSSKLSREIERVENQVDQALYYARSTTVKNDYAIKEVGLSDCIREACKRNARFLIEHHTTPRIEVDDGFTVLTDEAWLIFMLSQIIVNASKYGASTITFSAVVNNDATAYGCTVLEIKDDGCGIPACDVQRVFDRGFTGQVGRKYGSATGMGLYLVACLCKSLGLHVGLASEEGIGTRVMLTFPHDRTRKRLMMQQD